MLTITIMITTAYYREVINEVCSKIAKASQAFVHFREPSFQNNNLVISTERIVYRVVCFIHVLYKAEI